MGIYEISINNLEGKKLDLSVYKGKVLLIVNVASQCGFTPQYKEMQTLHNNYKNQGLCVMAFPCNDFANQEPGSINQIRDFCNREYGAKFGIFEKIKIRGVNPHPLYKYLEALFLPVERPRNIKAKFFQGFTILRFWIKEKRFPQAGEVQWNFHKFIVDRNGYIVGHFSSDYSPFDPKIIACIENQLGIIHLDEN